MTTKSRYFLMGSAGILLLGIGGGLVAYYALNRAPALPIGLPAELRFVPADASLVAYADLRAVMASDMRRELERITVGQRRGQQQRHEFAGIDLEKDVNHVIAYLQPIDAANSAGNSEGPPHALILAQGTFDQAKVEQFLKDHGGSVEDYNGKHVIGRQTESRGREQNSQPGQPDRQNQAVPSLMPSPVPSHVQEALAFVQPDLIATGPIDLVRRALDLNNANSTVRANITGNLELMKLIGDASSGNVWVVGRFDAVSRRIGLPANLQQQVPPLRLVSASAHIDGGVKATIKAETADKTAADQLRDVVRGAISFARLQAGAKPELQDALKSIELGGKNTDVQLSFQITPEVVRAMIPQPPHPDQPPPPPPPTAPRQ
jgi:hypothetical protein